MSGSPFATIALLACTWMMISAAVALLCCGLAPWFERGSAAWRPSTRSTLLTLLATAPAFVPTVVVLLCTAPGVAGLLTGRGDHCPAHLEHVHLCLLHGRVAWSPILAIGGFAFVCAAGAILGTGVRQALLARERHRALRVHGARSVAPGVWILHTSKVMALTAGILRPRIWLSSGLIERLTPGERAVVLAHERAHADRRDPARFAIASCLSRLHWPPLRHGLLAALSLASEQACDEVAAHRTGDRIRVAETLVRVERLLVERSTPGPRTSLQAGLTGSTLPLRVKRLLADLPTDLHSESAFGISRSARGRVLAASVAGGLLLAVPLHHAVEHALEFMARWL